MTSTPEFQRLADPSAARKPDYLGTGDDLEIQRAALRAVGDADALALVAAATERKGESSAAAYEGPPANDTSPGPQVGTHAPRATRPRAIYLAPTAQRVVPLVAPFKIKGKTIRSLTFSEPSFQDIDDIAVGRIDGIALRARMAGVSEDVIRALKWSDSEVVSLVVRLLAPDLGQI